MAAADHQDAAAAAAEAVSAVGDRPEVGAEAAVSAAGAVEDAAASAAVAEAAAGELFYFWDISLLLMQYYLSKDRNAWFQIYSNSSYLSISHMKHILCRVSRTEPLRDIFWSS